MLDFSTVSGSTSGSSPLELSKAQVDKQAFLELLVTQLKSQDPFEPLKNEEFLAQLAQFSSLESLNNIHEDMSTANLLQSSVHNALSTSLLGSYGVTAGNTVTVSEAGVSNAMFTMPDDGAAVVEIVDASGTVVRKIEMNNLGAGDHTIDWDGKDSAGDAIENGRYGVRAVFASGSRTGEEAAVFAVGRIRAVRFVGGNPVIVIGENEYSLSSLVEVMDALPGEGA